MDELFDIPLLARDQNRRMIGNRLTTESIELGVFEPADQRRLSANRFP
ncbi:hypothetical protein [uncultured Exiguobacterium sp.]|nr:hypothetical protein [uncultured Exiguobacterium sp.]